MRLRQRPGMPLWSSIIRVGLFILILGLGVVATLVVGEVESLARADLSSVPVRAVTPGQERGVLYATLADETRPGIYRSEDNGRTWQLASSGPGVSLNALAVHPGNKAVLYAGAPGGPVATSNNLWRSNDGGQTWHKFFLSLPGNVDGLIPAVTALAVDRSQPESLYVGTDGQGVYQFNVGRDGYGYELVGGVSMVDAHVTNLAIGPDSRIYALTPAGIFINRDNESWEKLDTLPDYPVSVAVAPTDPQLIYAGSASSGAYRSTDGGRTWTNIAEGLGLIPGAALRVTALTVDESDAQHVAAATAYGIGKQIAGGSIYESRDGGDSWTQLGETEELVNELIFSDGAIHAVTAKGLIRYGTPDTTEPGLPFGLDSLIQLSGLQLFMLALTTGLGGLALISQKKWG
ncbi:MAG: hypothetical protein KJ077_20740 [Anaerolineae bacterium]|nr:hypothetical protein [Anaerolineae bacterium]